MFASNICEVSDQETWAPRKPGKKDKPDTPEEVGQPDSEKRSELYQDSPTGSFWTLRDGFLETCCHQKQPVGECW